MKEVPKESNTTNKIYTPYGNTLQILCLLLIQKKDQIIVKFCKY
jgi:hypothetical protein